MGAVSCPPCPRWEQESEHREILLLHLVRIVLPTGRRLGATLNRINPGKSMSNLRKVSGLKSEASPKICSYPTGQETPARCATGRRWQNTKQSYQQADKRQSQGSKQRKAPRCVGLAFTLE